MISLKQTLKVLKNHMRTSLRHVPAGVATDSVATPAYACDKYGLPPICKASQKHHEVQKICAEFYNALGSGEHQVICPFGINISYLKMDNVSMPIGFFLQTGYTPETFRTDTIKNLNRVPKKAIKVALEATPLFKFSLSNESATLNLLSRTLQTLLAGRVAASMRDLTHQILTPVQGAINDIEQIKTGNQEALITLEGNVDEINSFAKKIHVLLSEDTEPTSQSIRTVVVHNIIHKICERFESLTKTKNLLLLNHYNSGIKVVQAVPDQLVIVFRCLLENAVKYSFRGAPGRERTIDIFYADTRMYDVRTLKVFIQSYGCPITPDEIKERKIFELGYRGEFSGDRGRQGTGSGLYIADRIVYAHYGKIEVESRTSKSLMGEEQALNIFSVFWPKYFPEQPDQTS